MTQIPQDNWIRQVEITAHRGDSSEAPENTLMAFESAIESGADWIEMDINQTKDGTLVVFHDEDLERLTGEEGKIWDITFEELRTRPVSQSLGPAFQEACVPSLEEALELCQGRIRLNLEIKRNSHQSQDFTSRVVKMLQEKGMENQCVITSFQYDVLTETKALAPGLETGLITSTDILEPQTFTAADQFILSIELIRPETVEELHDLGKEVTAWTVNDDYALEQCRLAGADNLITDCPQDIKEKSEI